MADNPDPIPTQQSRGGGGAAFPSPLTPGMTLRDYFAAAIIDGAARVGGLPNVNHEDMEAERAYRMADAMLKARDLKALPVFPWGQCAPDAFAASANEILRALELQADVFMVNNPQGSPQERALWHSGWILKNLALLLRCAMNQKDYSAAAGVALLKTFDAVRPIALQFSSDQNRGRK